MINDKKFDKVLPLDNRIKDIDKYFFIKRKTTFKNRIFTYFVMMGQLCFIAKCVCSIIVYNYKSDQIQHYKMFLLSTFDLTYFMPKIRFYGNLAYILAYSNSFLLQIVHHQLFQLNGGQLFRWTKIFQMLSGNIKLSQLELTNWNDIMAIVKR